MGAASTIEHGLLRQARDSPVPREEIRFGVILNGGVSLAVWMGGGVLELDRLTKAASGAADADPVYAALLTLCGCTARADVIAGTSAGGINGAALALSQVNRSAKLAMLRDIWSDQGRIESLLRQPFRGSPSSLLRGDEFFLPALNDALGRLASPADVRPAEEAPVDLTITTTVLRGNQTVAVDSMGQRLPQALHAGRFRWQRLPDAPLRHSCSAPKTCSDTDPCSTRDPFSQNSIERTAHRLALAARSTASFPVAFEPVFVPVGSPLHAEPVGQAWTEEQRLRPDMHHVVSSWGDEHPRRDRSRYVVDGGALANTPTRAALEGVESMPSWGPVRRVMLLVYPHAGQPVADTGDTDADPPTLVGTMSGLLGALTAQGSRTFVDELEQHNRAAAGRRGMRGDILSEVDGPDELEVLASGIYAQYARLRRWRAGRDLAGRAVTRSSPDGEELALPATWNFERTRFAAHSAQEWWSRKRAPARGRPRVPYFPDQLPTARKPANGPGWAWGVTAAVGVASAVADLLRRLVWVLEPGPDYDKVATARRRVSELSTEIRAMRAGTDAHWDQDPLLTALEPNESYWRLRLASYERLMLGGPDADDAAEADQELARFIDAVVKNERTRDPSEGHEAALRKALEVVHEGEPGSAGDAVWRRVARVVAHLRRVLPVLDATRGADELHVLGDHLTELADWYDVLMPGGRIPSPRLLLTRLLQLEVASTTLGDEGSTGADLPVEIVQLSAHAENAFPLYTRTGDDKLGGWSLNRFGGFIKRSWRVNDWVWGRIDAASVLCRTVLHPGRVRRTALLSGVMSAPVWEEDEGDLKAQRKELRETAAATAQRTIDELVVELFEDDAANDPRVRALRNQAVEELTPVFDPGTPTGDLASALPALADLFAWALHLRIVPAELPALAAAIRADRVDGANPRSRGETFLLEHQDLLTRLSAPNNPPVTPDDRIESLAAFDRAGIGREPWSEETSSDLTIRAATTAAAVAATVVDSDRSGLAAVKPVTRLLRGAMLLPFWTVTGLTSRSVLPRTLALLGLSFGAALLALALFGVLPGGLAGPATAVGMSALLVAFAYGAMRSGTMLHGLVLLTPVVALVAYAVNKARGADTADLSAQQGVATMAVVLGLSLSLIVLGSMPAATGSVWAALDRLANRTRVPAVKSKRGFKRGVGSAVRRTEGVLRAISNALPSALLIAGVAALGWWLATSSTVPGVRFVRDHALLLAAASVLLVVASGAWAFWRGRCLQLLRVSGADKQREWTYAVLTDPAGAAAGWSVVYGAAYLVLAAVLVSDPSDVLSTLWGRALLATSVVLAGLLLAVVPVWLPLAALVRAERREVARAREVAAFELPPEDVAVHADAAVTASRGFATDLVVRGSAYRSLVRDRPGDDKRQPSLTPRGRWLERRVAKARESVPALRR